MTIDPDDFPNRNQISDADEASQSRALESSPFLIGTREIEPGRTFVIAEVAQNHDGSAAIAHSYVDAVASAGADAVKFQTHIAASESTLDEPFRVPLATGDSSRFDYWKRVEFSKDTWKHLHDHATQSGLAFLSSPFSFEAVDLLRSIGVNAWKLSSGEANSERMLRLIAGLGQPTIVSTGLSTWEDIDKTVSLLREHSVPFALLQCTSRYPTSLEDVGLNIIDEFRTKYGCLSGLSDHSGSIWPGIAAMATGCDILEVHVTFDRRMFGPDQVVSLTIDELALLMEARNAITLMRRHPSNKTHLPPDVKEMKQIFGKSWTSRIPLASGTVLTEDILTLKKPGSGIVENEIGRLLGRTLRRPVDPERLIVSEDVDE